MASCQVNACMNSPMDTIYVGPNDETLCKMHAQEAWAKYKESLRGTAAVAVKAQGPASDFSQGKVRFTIKGVPGEVRGEWSLEKCWPYKKERAEKGLKFSYPTSECTVLDWGPAGEPTAILNAPKGPETAQTPPQNTGGEVPPPAQGEAHQETQGKPPSETPKETPLETPPQDGQAAPTKASKERKSRKGSKKASKGPTKEPAAEPAADVTKEEFAAFVKLQKSGEINMVDVKGGAARTGMSKDHYKLILRKYEDYSEQWPEVVA